MEFSWIFSDVRRRHILCSELERLSVAVTRQHDVRVQVAAGQLAQAHVAAWLVLQKRQKGHLPGDDRSQSLHLALPGQNHPLHGQVSTVSSLSLDEFIITEYLEWIIWSSLNFLQIILNIDLSVKSCKILWNLLYARILWWWNKWLKTSKN